MGASLGIAMGAKLAQPEKTCVAFMGDGAFGMVGMDFETAVREEIPIIAIVSIFLVPITGVMLILVSRFALKPMVETLSEALRDSRQSEGISPWQFQELTEQIETLTAEVKRLQEAQEFDRELLGSGEE